jgi:hypothetical protein
VIALAKNAQPILSARLRGFKPDQMVMVSLVGRIDSDNQTVYADPAAQYDWRWTHGLDIGVWIGNDPNWAHTLKAIALARPDYLCIWHPEQSWGARVFLIPTADDVSKPVALWQYELDFLPWLQFQNRDFTVGRTYARTPQGMPQ